jgi:NTP pyrophosphatase (non-canonical NTP hydrolase)
MTRNIEPYLTLADYQKASLRTMPCVIDTEQKLILALGLNGEAGELGELLKKHYGHGIPLDPAKLASELGDVLWYLAAIATAHGIDLNAVARGNIWKLRQRYPDGFHPGGGDAR